MACEQLLDKSEFQAKTAFGLREVYHEHSYLETKSLILNSLRNKTEIDDWLMV
jgi:hypothetical protein